MRKHSWIVFICLASAFAIVIIGLAFLWIRGAHNENKTKQLLSSEIDRLPIPESCKELKRAYQTGGVDTSSAWFVDYSCANVTIGSAQNAVTDTLKSQGYSAKDNDSDPAKISFANSTFYVDYYFARSLDNSDYQTPYKPESPLQQLSLRIYRAGRTY